MLKTMTKAARANEKVNHPIIDADGHFVEIGPLLDDRLAAHLEEVGGKELRDQYIASNSRPFNTANVLAGREDLSVKQEWKASPSWWGWQTKTH